MAAGVGADLDPWMDDERRRLEAEVAGLEAELVDAEVAVETLRVELAHFAYEHHHRLGSLYFRLDELDAEVAEAVALRTGDLEDLRRAREARARVEEAEAGRAEPGGPDPDRDAGGDGAPGDDGGGRGGGGRAGRNGRVRVRPTREAQRLYRELARRAHPDLAQEPAEKGRREEFIRRVNEAYATGDVDRLQRLSEEWAVGPDAAPPVGSADRTGWLRSRRSWLEARLAEVRAEQAELAASPIGQLLSLDPSDPDGLLERLAEQLWAQVTKYEDLLRRAQMGDVGSAG